jgi:hypothetical protein
MADGTETSAAAFPFPPTGAATAFRGVTTAGASIATAFRFRGGRL